MREQTFATSILVVENITKYPKSQKTVHIFNNANVLLIGEFLLFINTNIAKENSSNEASKCGIAYRLNWNMVFSQFSLFVLLF